MSRAAFSAMSNLSLLSVFTGCDQIHKGLPEVSKVKVQTVSFGQVWARDEITQSIQINNSTSSDAYITSFQKSCRCMTIRPEQLRIPSYGNARVEVLLDGKTRIDELEREVSFAIVPVTAENTLLDPIQIKGQIRCPIAVNHSLLQLGEYVVDSPTPTGRFTITRHTQCSVPDLSFDDTKIQCSLSWADASDVVGALSVQPATGLSPGEYVTRIRLTSSCEKIRDRMSKELSVTWYVLPRTISIPRAIALGHIKKAERRICSINFEGREGSRLLVSPCTPIPAGVSISAGVGPNSFLVTVNAATLDQRNTNLSIPFDASYIDKQIKEHLAIPLLYSFIAE
jgi:hypothetical protein